MSRVVNASHASCSVAGATFNDVDASGVEWIMETISGWHGTPAVNREETQRTLDHGSFPGRGHRVGRTIGITGLLRGPSRAAVGRAVDRLAALLADGTYDRFIFSDDDQGDRWADVQLATGTEILWDSGFEAPFNLQLFAPDPRKYAGISSASAALAGGDSTGVGMVFDLFRPSGSISFGTAPGAGTGTASIVNVGTAPSWPIFQVTGPIDAEGFVITELETGARIRYLGPLELGNTLTIDARRGTVTLNGTADRTTLAIIDAWPQVPREGGRDYLFESLGAYNASARLGAEVTTAYW